MCYKQVRHLIYLIKCKRQYGGKVETLFNKHLYNNRPDAWDSNTIQACYCYTYNNHEFITMINSFSQKQSEAEKNQKKSYRGFWRKVKTFGSISYRLCTHGLNQDVNP